MKLEKNQRQCPYCKEVLTSTSNYDLKTCKCGHLTIDGGADNLRVITNEISSKPPTEGSQSDEVDKPKKSGGQF